MATHPFCNRCESAIREEHGRTTGRCLSCCEIETCAACAAKETNDCSSDELACCSNEGCESGDSDCCDAKIVEE